MMLEILLGLAVLAMAAAAAIVLSERAANVRLENELVAEVSYMNTLIAEIYPPTALSKVSIDALIDTKSLKHDWYNTQDGILVTPWKTTITLAYGGGGIVDFYLWNLSYDECGSVVRHAQDFGNTLDFLQVNNSGQMSNIVGYHTPITPKTFEEYCGTGVSNFIILAMRVED